MLVAKVVIRSVAMKKFRITGRSLFVTGSVGMKQPCVMSHFELKFIVVVYDARWYLAVTKIDSCRG